MSPRTIRRLAPLALAAVLVLPGVAACSSDDDTATGDATAQEAGSGAEAGASTTITPAEAMALLDERDDVVVVDVRTPEEYAEGHLAGALNVNLQGPDFAGEIAELPLDGTYVVYCRSGNRSAQAVEIMVEAGFTDVRDLGGIGDWEAAGGEVVTD